MLPLGLFRLPTFAGVQLAAFAVSAALLAMFLYLSLYLQNHLGYSPLEAGLRYLPITLLAFLLGPVPGALLSRVPARLLLSAGLGMVGAGLLLMSGIETGSEWTTLLSGFLVAGAGIGLLNPVIADVAVSAVPEEQSGMAAGINNTFRQVGIAVGIAAWGALLVGRGADKVGELLANTRAASGVRPRELIEAASSGTLDQALATAPPPTQQLISRAASEGFRTGLNHVLTLGAVLSFAGAALALWLVRAPATKSRAIESFGEPEPAPLSEAADA